MKILVTIPGIGNSNFNEKKEFLKRNKNIIQSTFSGDVDFLIFNYSDNDFSDIDGIKVIKEKGIIGEFIFKYLKPETLGSYDYIILIMDDVLLSDNINIDKMIEVYKNNNLNILSPALTNDSETFHRFMIKDEYYKECLRITNFSEFFFYLMDIKSYERYYKTYDEKTYWTWGIDMCISLLGLKIGILNHYTVKHFFKGVGYNEDLPDPKVEMKIKEDNFGRISEIRNIEIVRNI